MLSLLSQTKLDLSFHQNYVCGKKVHRLLKNNVMKRACARNYNSYCELVLYTRFNSSGMNEAGIIYSPGPACLDWKNFPMEMLRIFSIDRDTGFNLAAKYYIDLVTEQVFHYE